MSIETIKKLKGAIVKKDKQKSRSKSIGIKSTFVTDNGIAISSVAEKINKNGLKAPNIEVFTSRNGDEIYQKHFKMLLDAKVSGDTIHIDGLTDSIEMSNPAKSDSLSDYIGIKAPLEKKYFGAEFENDNIHVQIAYNIADIKKHIMLFINQIIYTFYNINRSTNEFDTYNDLIGTLYVFADLNRQEQQKNLDAVKELLRGVHFYDAYFPGVFKLAKLEKDGSVNENEKRKCDSYNYNVLRLISSIRQACEHEVIGSRQADELFYNIESILSGSSELLNLLDGIYEKMPKRINKDFENHSQNNLFVLSKIFPSLSRDKLIEEYYRYSILKEQNNSGVNLKLTREIIIESYMTELRNKRYDTYRSKIYTSMGFALTQWLKDSQLLCDTVAKLRANRTEEGRLQIYIDLAKEIWNEHSSALSQLISEFDKEAQNKFKSNFQAKIDVCSKDYALGSNGFSYFSKLMLFMTMFLDGKEINELLTGLISRFNNISDLILSAEECGVRITFKPEYRLFKKSLSIAGELGVIKSISKMKQERKTVKNCMLIDAVNILGIKQPILYENECTSEDQLAVNKSFLDRIHSGGNTEKPDHQLRNFLINNVINSRWFFYIARYTKPTVCGRLMSNEKLVRFILKEIPDEQIERYYKSVSGRNSNGYDAREYLFNRIHRFSIDKILDDVEKLDKRDYRSQNENSEKQKNKALVGLYLTMIYLAVKSIVKVNAVFSIAFSCLERDISLKALDSADLLSVTKATVEADSLHVADYNALRDSIRDNSSLSKDEKKLEYKKLLPILKKMHYSLHSYYCVKSNLDIASSLVNSKIGFFKLYRNCIAHLNIAVEFTRYVGKMKTIDSYFSIFVFCLQNHIIKLLKGPVLSPFSSSELSSFADTQSSYLGKKGNYSRDMLWILNTPFAYNMARYKNLSIEDLYYGTPSPSPTVQVRLESAAESNVKTDNFKIGDTVTMTNTTATVRGGLRGFIADSDVKVCVSPKSLNGANPKSFEGKELTVEIVAWDTNGETFNAKLK